jgi:hypothetical protein
VQASLSLFIIILNTPIIFPQIKRIETAEKVPIFLKDRDLGAVEVI